MKKLLLGFITLLSILNTSAQTPLPFIQQVNYYYANQVFNGASFTNNSAADISMNTLVNSNSQVVAWRKFNTAGDNTGVNRPMNIGDDFSITVSATRARGQIGIALLASPSSTLTYADRESNYAVSVNLDGPDFTGASTYTNWYVKSIGGLKSSTTLSGAQGTYSDYQIDFFLVAKDRMNITVLNLNTTVSSTIYDVQLNTSNPITDYSIYLSDADDGSFTAKNIVWKQQTQTINNGVLEIGRSNNSFTINNAITDGTDVSANTPVMNQLNKYGTGTVILGSASTYSDITTLNAGTLTMGTNDGLPTVNNIGGAPASIAFNGGTLSSGASTGFNIGTSTSNTAGALILNQNSSITLGTGNHNLYFAASNALPWGTGKILTINGWQGTPSGGTGGRIFIGTNASGLTSGQKLKINFTGYGTKAQLLPTGELVPISNAAPTTPSSSMIFSNIQLDKLTINFTPGNGTGGRIVVARAGVAPSSGPANGATYTANTTYGTGSLLGNGFVVYNGTGSSFTVTGLAKNTTYYFDVYEYNGSGTSSSYGSKYESSQATISSYTTIADGNWEDGNVWLGGVVPAPNSPITINNAITLLQDESASDIIINSAKSLSTNGHILTISTSSINNGSHIENGAGEFKFVSANNIPISGTGIYKNVESTITSGNLILTSNVTIDGNLIITNNAVSLQSNTLTINGAISGTSKLISSSSANLIIGGAAGIINFDQTNASNRSLNNLTLNNTASAIKFGTNVDLYGVVTSTNNSVIDFNFQTVTLKSSATTNAIIGPLSLPTQNIVNATNVIAERYIPSDRRAFRTISSGGVDAFTTTIQDNWQEHQMNTIVGVNVNNIPGFGTQITGTGGNANGFDVTQTNYPSLYTYNSPQISYDAVPSTTVPGMLTANNPYLMYIRGDRSIDVTSQATPLPTSSTTLRVTGSLVTGDQDITSLLVGNPDGSANNGYNLISNPFAAYLDFDLLSADYPAIAFNYTYVDPTIGAQGGYVTYNTLGTVTPSVSHPVTNFIQPGQSFFIQFYSGNPGAIPVTAPFLIKETYKSTTGFNPTVFKAQTAQQLFRADIFLNDAGTRRVADGVAVVYDNKYSLNVDKYDAGERALYEHIAIVRNNTKLQIEARPLLAPHDTLNLYLSGMNTKTKNYELQLNAINFSQPGMKAELIDNFMKTRTPVSLTGITNYPFIVTTDINSTNSRFSVVFSPLAPLPVTLTNIKAYRQNTGIQVEWNLSQESNVNKYEIERSANSTSFVTIGSELSKGNSSNAVKYNFFDATPISGDNYYRIKAIDKNGSLTYSQVVNVNFGSIVANVSVYPNPVVNNVINIHIDNFVKGTYPVTITNQLGQIVYSKELVHPGGSTIETIKLKNTLRAGIYQLKVGTYSIKILKQ